MGVPGRHAHRIFQWEGHGPKGCNGPQGNPQKLENSSDLVHYFLGGPLFLFSFILFFLFFASYGGGTGPCAPPCVRPWCPVQWHTLKTHIPSFFLLGFWPLCFGNRGKGKQNLSLPYLRSKRYLEVFVCQTLAVPWHPQKHTN